MIDPIVEEIRQNRENILKENNYDIARILGNQQKEQVEMEAQGFTFITKVELEKLQVETA